MYTPKINMFQSNNSIELHFEDLAFRDANATVITTSTLRIVNEIESIDVELDMDHAEGFFIDTPYNGYRASTTAFQLGRASGSVIPDGIYEITYTYDYIIDGIQATDQIKRRFALFAIKEREVYDMIYNIHKHYTCDKPWASKYIIDALTARGMVKALEINAYMGFEDDYYKILDTLNKILIK